MTALRSLAQRDQAEIHAPPVQVLLSSLPLRMFIRAFEYHPPFRDTASGIIPVWPHPYATLRIRLGDPVEVFERRLNQYRVLPDVILTGPITGHIADLLTRGRCTSQFLIVFQPGGVLRLLGVPATTLTDQAIAANALLGPRVRALADQVRAAPTLAAMVKAAESFLLGRAARAVPPTPVERAAQAQLRSRGRLPIAELIRATGYGRARFERTFLECVGVPPKMFARLARFDYALRLYAADPTRSWIDISHEAGYFDQNHLVKEFKAMTGQLPSGGHDPQWRICGGDGLSEQTDGDRLSSCEDVEHRGAHGQIADSAS